VRDALHLAVRLGLGGVFLWAGLVKATHPQDTILAVDAYAVLPDGLVRVVAAVMPWAEIAAGALLLTGLFVRAAALGTAVLSFAFLLGMAQAAIRGLDISCGCFGGTGAGEGVTWIEIARDLAFLAAAGYLFLRPGGPLQADHRLDRPPRKLAVRRRMLAGRAIAVTVAAVLLVPASISVIDQVGDRSGAGHAPSADQTVTIDGPARTTALQPGDRMPTFEAPGLTGGRSGYGASGPAQATVLIVWAPWCPYCQKELPLVGRVAVDYPGVHVQTVVTAIGARPGPDPLSFLQENGLDFPTAVDDEAGTLFNGFGIQNFPTSFYIGSDGVIVQTMVGATEEPDLRALFADLAALG